jgi:hypothetical protein
MDWMGSDHVGTPTDEPINRRTSIARQQSCKHTILITCDVFSMGSDLRLYKKNLSVDWTLEIKEYELGVQKL